jgi:hypothetical protein
LAAVLLALLLLPQAFAADGVAVRSAEIRAGNEGYELDAQFAITPTRTLEEALQKGVALYFVVELEVSRPRTWWFDEDVGEAVRRMKIYYNFLLRRYIVDAGYVTKTAPTLDEALAILGRVEGWQVLERGALRPGQRYTARVRLRTDTSQMPKPLQIAVLGGSKWSLESPWYVWSFDAPASPKADKP